MEQASKGIESAILRDYGTIAKLADEQGREWWRKQVCEAIFGPIAAQYPKQAGYIEAADYGLGCAFPVALSEIQAGDTVVDLGCATGIDSFIAAEKVGKNGGVIGFDLTPELIAKAKEIANGNQIENVHFEVANIENLPLEDESVDAIISNGVFSLLENRDAVFREMYRILRPNGHFLIADLTRKHPFSEDLHTALRNFTGCINGISHFEAYTEAAKTAGFQELALRSKREVDVPSKIQQRFSAEFEAFAGESPLWAIGLYGRKA